MTSTSILLLVVLACGGETTAPTAAAHAVPTPSPAAAAATIRVAFLGDSLPARSRPRSTAPPAGPRDLPYATPTRTR